MAMGTGDARRDVHGARKMAAEGDDATERKVTAAYVTLTRRRGATDTDYSCRHVFESENEGASLLTTERLPRFRAYFWRGEQGALSRSAGLAAVVKVFSHLTRIRKA